MPDLLDTRLHDLIGQPDAAPALQGVHRRARRRRTARRLAAVAVLLVAVSIGTALLRATGDGASDVHVGPPTGDGAVGWTPLPMPPVRWITGAAWAGDQLVAWGPRDATATEDDVYAYDRAGGEWLEVSTSGGVDASSAVWTGAQLVFLGDGAEPGVGGPPEAPQAEAWTPTTGEWTTVSSQPTPCSGSPVWTGSYVVTACSSADGEGVGAPELHRLDLEDGTWTDAGAPPTSLVADGEGLELRGFAPALARLGDDVALVAHRASVLAEDPLAFSYDPAADRWSELPGGAVPLTPQDPDRGRGFGPLALTPTADGLLAVSGDRTAARYVADDGRWEQLADIPTRSTVCLPEVVVAGGTPVADLCAGVGMLGPDGSWTTAAYPGDAPYGEQTPGRWIASGELAVLADPSALHVFGPPASNAEGQIPFLPTVPLVDASLEVPAGAEVRSVEIVAPGTGFTPDGTPVADEQLQATLLFAGGHGCTVTTGSPFRGDSRPVAVEVHGVDGSLSRSAEGSTVRWSWTPGTATWHQLQVTCPTDEQALDLAEQVLPPATPPADTPVQPGGDS